MGHVEQRSFNRDEPERNSIGHKELKRRQVQRMAATAQPLQPAENPPGPGRGHTKKPHEKAKAGNRSDYLVARITRDRPDILERMKAGAFTSVREAAREAGIIKDVLLVEQVVRLWEKATPEERQAIRKRLAIDADQWREGK